MITLSPTKNMDASPAAIAQSQLVLQVVTLALVAWTYFRQKALIKSLDASAPQRPKVSEES